MSRIGQHPFQDYVRKQKRARAAAPAQPVEPPDLNASLEQQEQWQARVQETETAFGEWEKEKIERAHYLFNTPSDVLRQDRLRAEELEHERAKAAVWQAKPSADPTLLPANVNAKKLGNSLSKQPRGRQKSAETCVLEQALNSILRDMSEGGTLEDICARLKDKGIKFRTPATDRQASRLMEYPDALHDRDYFNTVRMRIRKILKKKLLPKS